MPKRKMPKVNIIHQGPDMSSQVSATAITMGTLIIQGGEAVEWLDKVRVKVESDSISIEVRRSSPPDSEEWGPSVNLRVHADGGFHFSG